MERAIYKTVGTYTKEITKKVEFQRFQYMPYLLSVAMDKIREIGNMLVDKRIGDDQTFKINRDNQTHYENMVKYVHGDPNSIYDLNKSLGYLGRTGSGKTLAFKIMSEYIKIDEVKYRKGDKLLNFNFKIYSARQIVSDFTTGGFDAIEKYIVPNIICIDDIGTETATAQFYGNKVNVIEQIFEERYMYGKITHFSSNMNLKLLTETYGERVASRIHEKTNLIEWRGEDWRMAR